MAAAVIATEKMLNLIAARRGSAPTPKAKRKPRKSAR
jgi:hypothetical protein